MNPFLWIFLVAFPVASFASERVRHVSVLKDQIVNVRTAIGIATIVQVSDSPNSVVVGDQDAFKVEYLDQAITIKPLRGGAKSNLYVYTDWQRYNVQLITGNEAAADYVVYLDHPKSNPPATGSTIRWSAINKLMRNEQLRFETKRCGATTDLIFVEFELSASSKEKINPSYFWVVQRKLVRPIHNLMLSGLDVSQNQNVKGVIQIKKSDIDKREPFRIEMRRKKTTYLILPKVVSWN